MAKNLDELRAGVVGVGQRCVRAVTAEGVALFVHAEFQYTGFRRHAAHRYQP